PATGGHRVGSSVSRIRSGRPARAFDWPIAHRNEPGLVSSRVLVTTYTAGTATRKVPSAPAATALPRLSFTWWAGSLVAATVYVPLSVVSHDPPGAVNW